jgi:hypothetical protein
MRGFEGDIMASKGYTEDELIEQPAIELLKKLG